MCYYLAIEICINLIFVKLFGSLGLTLQTNIVSVRSESLVGLNKGDQEGDSETSHLEEVDHALLLHDKPPSLLTQVGHQALVPFFKGTQLLQLL